jgi:transposase
VSQTSIYVCLSVGAECEYEQKKLHRLKRQRANQVNSRHARIILLARGGLRNRDIADQVDCSPQWVRVIIHRFNQDGLTGISWYPFWQVHDQPRKFLADVREQLAEVALSSPVALIGMKRWSLTKLRDYLVAQNILPKISLEWLRTLLRRLGIRWRHTKTWKESTDPEFWQKYRRIRRLYRHRPAGGRRLCVDEFGPLNLQPRHGRSLARGGKVQRLRATYHRKGGVRHFLAYYDLETDRLYGRFTRRKTWMQFLAFLKWVRSRYPRWQTLHIVMDNYGAHVKEEVRQWALSHNIRFYLTPTQASWLNRIEGHFTALKQFALQPSDHRSHEEQQAAIWSYLDWRNWKRQISCQSWKDYQRLHKKVG